MKTIDLRSDTVTLPTPEMRKAMFEAKVGDDVYGEDPTINELEKKAAQIMGKEAALFVMSGTMGNQIAVKTHTNPGDEIILEENSHILIYEVGGIAAISGVQPRPLKGERGVLKVEDIKKAIRPDDIHQPSTTLICLENTHNRAGGTVIPLQTMKEIKALAQEHGIPVHLDGARIFNAAVALGVDVSEIARYADSVMFCLSKGLCAPVGSVLVGDREFIDRARKYRKMFGGGIRQGGVLAAAGLIALEKMTKRLKEDHANARFLAENLAAIPGITVDLETVQTNIVFHNIEKTGLDGYEYAQKLKEFGILINPAPKTLRMVTHWGITREDICYTLEVIEKIVRGG